MKICKEKHAEVCYEEWGCPVCEQKQAFEDKIEDLESKIEELTEQLQEKE